MFVWDFIFLNQYKNITGTLRVGNILTEPVHVLRHHTGDPFAPLALTEVSQDLEGQRCKE